MGPTGAVNSALITLGPSLIPPPAGVDVTDAASLSAGIHRFEPRHFVMPFLAHAVRIAFAVGAVFLCGGVAARFMIPAPAWFVALDLLAAYVPMAWLGVRIGASLRRAPGGARARA